MTTKTGNDRITELREALKAQGIPLETGNYTVALEGDVLELWLQLQAAEGLAAVATKVATWLTSQAQRDEEKRNETCNGNGQKDRDVGVKQSFEHAVSTHGEPERDASQQ